MTGLQKAMVSATTFLVGPFSALAAGETKGIVPSCADTKYQLCTFQDVIKPDGLLDNVITFLIFDFAVPVAVLVFMYAGWKMLSQPTKAGARGEAKKMMLGAIIGLLISLTAYVVVQFIVTSLASDNEVGQGIQQVFDRSSNPNSGGN